MRIWEVEEHGTNHPTPYCRTAPNVYWAERDKESGLTSITVPLTVTSMEASAFQGCTSLESAVIQAPLPTLPSRSLYKCDVRERGCSGGGRVRRARAEAYGHRVREEGARDSGCAGWPDHRCRRESHRGYRRRSCIPREEVQGAAEVVDACRRWDLRRPARR